MIMIILWGWEIYKDLYLLYNYSFSVHMTNSCTFQVRIYRVHKL